MKRHVLRISLIVFLGLTLGSLGFERAQAKEPAKPPFCDSLFAKAPVRFLISYYETKREKAKAQLQEKVTLADRACGEQGGHLEVCPFWRHEDTYGLHRKRYKYSTRVRCDFPAPALDSAAESGDSKAEVH